MLTLFLLLAAALSYFPLRKSHRLRARSVARSFYVGHPLYCQTVSSETLKRELRNRLGHYPEFSSVLSSLLLALAVRLAVALITHWIENRIAHPTFAEFAEGEPGAP